jgi:hypothetical protein
MRLGGGEPVLWIRLERITRTPGDLQRIYATGNNAAVAPIPI